MKEPLGTIHYARYQESPRLQRLLEFMLDGRRHTGMEISHGAHILAVSAAACELRENGFEMVCVRKLKPSIYQLRNVNEARKLAASLLGSVAVSTEGRTA